MSELISRFQMLDLRPKQFDLKATTKVAHLPSRYPREARIRVLHVGKYYPPYRGGMESHLELLSNELNGSVDLEVLVANTNWRTLSELIDGIKVTRVGKLFDLQSAPICPDLVRRIRSSRADIVHIHWPNPSAVLAYLASGHSGKLVLTYHSDVVRQRKLAALFTPVLRAALKRASAIIVSSPNYIDGSYVLPEFRSRCSVIPFGVPANYFDQVDEHAVQRIRETYGHRIILGVGRMVYYKGFEYLVRAMTKVNAQLLLIGKGPLRDPLIALAAQLGVRERVTFLSEVNDIRPYYHAADVFVLSSIMRSEAFGIVQLEAMASSTPVINTQLNSGVTFVSPHGVSGLTVPPEDPKALAESMNQLLADFELRAQLGYAAKQRVLKEFTVERMVQQTLDLYHHLYATEHTANPAINQEVAARSSYAES